MNKGKAVSVLN